MKPTSSALRQFLLLGALGTAAASSSSASIRPPWQRLRDGDREHPPGVTNDGPSLLPDQIPAREAKILRDATERDDSDHRGGVLRSESVFAVDPPSLLHSSTTNTNTDTNTNTNTDSTTSTSSDIEGSYPSHSHSECHPDLGVLACPEPGEFCLPVDPDTDADHTNHHRHHRHDHDHLHHRYYRCASPFDSVSRGLDAEFPPSGLVYDHCTYDKQLEYNYYSTIRQPSAWDRCACKGYDYDLPSQTTVYTDVDYCHKINIYYCRAYYDDRLDQSGYDDPSSYDACLCATYSEKGPSGQSSIPGKDANFCNNLPLRYCRHYFPDLLGGAKCLCENFDLQDYCGFTLPPGATLAPTPAPTSADPTASPTRGPTNEPTRDPTRGPTGNPTRDPTRSPTRKPTVGPTRTPTRKPTATPTASPTKRPTRTPTPEPTNGPTDPPTPFPPTDPPTNRPTGAPTTRAPTNPPTPRPPTNPPTPRPPTNPPTTRPPTMQPTMQPQQQQQQQQQQLGLGGFGAQTPIRQQVHLTPRPTAETVAIPVTKPRPPQVVVTETAGPLPAPEDPTPPKPLEVEQLEVVEEVEPEHEDHQQEQEPEEPEQESEENKKAKKIAGLKRQPNIGERPGESLRLPVFT